MRKYLYLGIIAASALVLASPLAEAAPTVHVLTVGKAGGTAVRPGAVLRAGLAKGSAATFSFGTKKLTCKTAASSATVASNPNAPGTARGSVTAQTFARCTLNESGVSVTSVTTANLPYTATVGDAKGHPVMVRGHTKTMPVSVAVKLKAGTAVFTCTYAAASITGHFSNTTNAVSFSKQRLNKSAGRKACLPEVNFTATFGPVVDTSVKGSPKVFVN